MARITAVITTLSIGVSCSAMENKNALPEREDIEKIFKTLCDKGSYDKDLLENGNKTSFRCVKQLATAALGLAEIAQTNDAVKPIAKSVSNLHLMTFNNMKSMQIVNPKKHYAYFLKKEHQSDVRCRELITFVDLYSEYGVIGKSNLTGKNRSNPELYMNVYNAVKVLDALKKIPAQWPKV